MGTVFQNTGLYIDLIHRGIPGNGFAVAVCGLGVRIGQFVIIVPFSGRSAFLAAVIPGNIATGQGLGQGCRCQSLGDADFTGQIFIAYPA